MTKKLVLFSDGTGNSSAKAQKTNVWRMYEALDLSDGSQLARYDNGVGSSKNRYFAAVGGAFGWGLKRNVLDLYKFVCRNYEHGDEIYGFGFSRGAFTIRVLVDLIANEGLVLSRSEEELNRNAAAAYRHYRSKCFSSWSPLVYLMRKMRDGIMFLKDRMKGFHSYEKIAKEIDQANRKEISIRFLGLWDTVEAYGMPVNELKRGIDWVLWPMLFGNFVLSPKVQRACHALSLDDERMTFHPLLWNEINEDDRKTPGRITQVWFSGMHSNVGGGYPEDRLSLVSLDWMMGEVMANGLVLIKSAVHQVRAAASPFGRIYDSRAGLGSYYRYSPRQIWVTKDKEGNRILPIIHGSVIMRMAYGAGHYSPITLPHEFWVLAPDGDLLRMEGAPLSLKIDNTKKEYLSNARPVTENPQSVHAGKNKLEEAIGLLARPDRQAIRLVWDTVFWRRCFYFLTVGMTCMLAMYPWVRGGFTAVFRCLLQNLKYVDGNAHDVAWAGAIQKLNAIFRGPITSLINVVEGFVPSFADWWLTEMKEHPFELILIGASILGLMRMSKILQSRLNDRARLAWHKDFRLDYIQRSNESKDGWRFGTAAVLLALTGLLIASWWLNPIKPFRLEISLVMMACCILVGWQLLTRKRASKKKNARIDGTAALSVARFLRNNAVLRKLYGLIFRQAIPITFAFLIVACGLFLLNRTSFDWSSAAGAFCESKVLNGKNAPEQLGEPFDFEINSLCLSTKKVLHKDRRYRITLSTPGDWFDSSLRSDVAGHSFNNAVLDVMTAPLKRWWGQSWFRPIVRIGSLGNDEYPLISPERVDPHKYKACKVAVEMDSVPKADNTSRCLRIKTESVPGYLESCGSTPQDRIKVVTEITARTSGELFLFVNDAVLMWPGQIDRFYCNNFGTGKISVDRIPVPVP